MPGNQSSHEKDSKAFILWIKVGKEVEFAKYEVITNVWISLHWNIIREGFQKKKPQTWAFGSTSADPYLPSELGPP